MKKFLCTIFVIALLFNSSGADLVTKNGKTYSDYKVFRVSARGLGVFHSEGACIIPFENLPDEIREKYKVEEERFAKIARKKEISEQIKADTKKMLETLARVHNLAVTSLDIQPHIYLERKEAEADVYISLIDEYDRKEKWKYHFVFTIGKGDKLYFKKNGFSSKKLD